jgi:nucleotide-binding universal stress UspA family protein
MRSILVATDFSPASKNAAKYAGSSLTILHAYLLPTPVSEVPYVMVSVDEIQKSNEEAAAQLAQDIKASSNIDSTVIVTVGMPADEVLYQSKENAIDLIVVGMRGESQALDKIIGSTTSALIRRSHLPVLVIPESAEFSSIKSVTYATDFSYKMNYRCLKVFREIFAKSPDAQLNIVHIQRPGEILHADQIAGKVMLEPMMEEFKHRYHTIENLKVEDGLNQFLESTPTDLLVMVAHKHNWWERLVNGSHTKHMLYKTHLPLLVLQDKD